MSAGESLYQAEPARRIGLIYQRLVDTSAARLQYREFLDAWSETDPVFHCVIEETRVRLATLGE